MENSEIAQSALDAVETISFNVGFKGYKVDEVDDFLERLTIEVRQLQDLAAQQRQQLRQAAERIAQLDARGPQTNAAPVSAVPAPAPAPAPRPQVLAGGAEQVTSMIAMAQEFIDQRQHEAEEKARELTASAQERAREIVAEARSRAEDEVNRLNGLKQRLSEDVDTLTRQLDAERKRLSSVLSELGRWIEDSIRTGASDRPAQASAAPPAAPAAAPVAPRPSQTPPPAPAPAAPTTIGQVLNFDQSQSHE